MGLSYILRLFFFCAGLSSFSFAALSKESTDFSNSLRAIYAQAVNNDPTFAKALADWNVQRLNVSLARSAYLPQAGVQGQAVRASTRISAPNGVAKGDNYQYGLTLSLYQPIFNLPAWQAIQGAHAAAKSAAASYMAAKQDLMLRVSQSYLGVLEAQDHIVVQQQRLRALSEQKRIAMRKVQAGNLPRTAGLDAQSQYDQAVALAVSLKTQKDMALERLFEITGMHFKSLPKLVKAIPLQKPKSSQLVLWIDKATKQNYFLIAKNHAVYAARRAIGEASTQWLPQLTLMGQYENQNQTEMHGAVLPSNAAAGHTNNFSYGLSLNFPFLQGGAVSATTQQNIQKYLSLSESRNILYRNILSQTRQSFLNVISGVAQIRADKVSLHSAQQAFNAMQASYQAGIRTALDTLTELSKLYDMRTSYISHQYQYLLSVLNLKFSAGTLSPEDIYVLSDLFFTESSHPVSSKKTKSSCQGSRIASENLQDFAIIPL